MRGCSVCGERGHNKATCGRAPLRLAREYERALAEMERQREIVDSRLHALLTLPEPPQVGERVWPRGSTAIKVMEIAAANPCMTLEWIASQVGVSRERVRQIVPSHAQGRRAFVNPKHTSELQAYINEHPEAILPLRDGGHTQGQIASAIGITVETLRKAWVALDLPDRAALFAADEPYSYARIMRWENCEACGKPFAWRYSKEVNWRAGNIAYRTCGGSCSLALHHRGQPYSNLRYVNRSAVQVDWARRNPIRVKSYRAKWGKKVLRTETCESCGKPFPWTRQQNIKHHGQWFACSAPCGRKIAAQRRRSA